MDKNKRFWCLNGYEGETSVIVDGKFAPTNEWLCGKLNELAEENQQLKNDCSILVQSNQEYRKENEQLQERNNRQAKQLNDLYKLIEEKDWRALSDIMDDFQKAEEQLQSEWQTYGDVE